MAPIIKNGSPGVRATIVKNALSFFTLFAPRRLNWRRFMRTRIDVLSRDGRALTPTYPKRARQLVKGGRAEWCGCEAIRLKRDREDFYMDSFAHEPVIDMTNDGPRRGAEKPAFDRDAPDPGGFGSGGHDENKLLKELARFSLAERRNIVGQVFDFFLICLTSVIYCAYSYDGDVVLLTVFFLGFWVIRLSVRLIKFARGWALGGVVNHFKTRKERLLESEFLRLKRIHRP
jgi:hypothetical protein